MYQSSKLTRVAIALGISVVLQVLFVVLLGLARSGGSDGLERILILLGGDFLNGGYIQFLTFAAFFWGLIEVRYYMFWTDFERKYLSVELLPGEEHVVLGEMEVNKIRLQVSDYLKKKKQESASGSYFLLEIIKKACTKFRSDNSSESAFMIVESQSRINREKTESTQSGIRYLLWAIPSIGFVGTILGISQSLSIAGSGDIDRITSALGVAFDTTLLALVLSLILMYLYHGLQEKNELLHHEIEEFVIENLINKIDVN
jgi:chemotaxis protein MotA